MTRCHSVCSWRWPSLVQLSVVATLGLILFSEKVAARLPFVPRTLGLREVVSTTLSTQAAVLPLLVLSVGQVSLVFLPANILILPLIPATMFVGFIAACLALFSFPLSFPFSAAAYGLLTYVIHVAVWLGELPFSSITVSQALAWILLAGLGAGYGFLFLYLQKKNRRESYGFKT